MTVNVVEVARRALDWEHRYVPHLGPLNEPMAVSVFDAAAMAKVVLAAAAVVDADYIDRDKAIAALDATLEGK